MMPEDNFPPPAHNTFCLYLRTFYLIASLCFLFIVCEPSRMQCHETERRRRCILDVRNRALLVFIWLRRHLNLHVLAHIFGIS